MQNKNEIIVLFKEHSAVFLFLLSVLTTAFIYEGLSKYIVYTAAFIILFYCVYVLFKTSKRLKGILLAASFIVISAFFVFLTFSSFYPSWLKISKKIEISSYTGWNYYNFMALSLSKRNVSFPIEPSEKLKNFPNPYNPEQLNKNFSYSKFEYIIDLSLYNGKYYLYFGLTPIITAYLPFILLTKHFINDALVVLIFSVLSYLVALLILKKVLDKTVQKQNILLYVVSAMAVGMSSAFPFLITMPRIYEVAIITGAFFCLLSYFFTFLFLEEKNAGKRKAYLFLSGLAIALAVGCRPFYVLTVFISALIMIDFKNIKTHYKEYLWFLLPLAVYGIILMVYNYLRFDSVFEFGHRFQLSVIDLYNKKFDFAHTISSIKNFLFFPPVKTPDFPYYFIGNLVVLRKLIESVVGIAYTAPYLISIVALGYGVFASRQLQMKYKKFLAGMLLTGLISLVIVSSAGSLFRFMGDFCIYFAIPAVVFIFMYFDRFKGISRYIFQYIVILMLFMSIVFNMALSVSMSLDAVNANNPGIISTLERIL